jgi:hypothetical protein
VRRWQCSNRLADCVELGRGVVARHRRDHSARRGLSGAVIATGQPYLNNNASDDPRLLRPHAIDHARRRGAPLIAHGRPSGLLGLAAPIQ